MTITQFFENQDIFITGGSGFIGKALIEKLLRSCPNVGKIFVLLRGKKSKNAEERLRDILNTSLYNRVRQEQPQAFRKVYAIEGDCSQLGLGISTEDLLKLQNVTIIYHSAASVRFDDALRDAVLLNTRGTFELIKIAETLKRLKVFVHVSTTYCYPDEAVVDEKVIPCHADWRTTIKLAETYDKETLDIFCLKYCDQHPNTYTFTKRLSEQIINEYKDKLPLVIFRPSIVTSSVIEPVPGWVDNFNGPMGLLIACGIGILRSNHADPDNNIAVVPIDAVTRSMLISCYKRGTECSVQHEKEMDVFNCSVANLNPISIGKMIDLGRLLIRDNPFEKTLWLPGGSVTRSRIWHLIRFITLHLLLAIVVDTGMRLAKEKPILLKLQRRIFAASATMHYFMTNVWVFRNEHFINLESLVPKTEVNEFGFIELAGVDYVKYTCANIRGAKEFLLHEPPESTQKARIRMKFFIVADFVLQLFTAFFVLRFLVRYIYRYFVF